MKNCKNLTTLFSLFVVLVLTMGLSAQTDGVDSTYAPVVTGPTPTGPSSESVQPDGKLIVTGGFAVVNGVPRTLIIRLNTDGSVDPTFACGACNFNIINTLVQPDGKIIVAGWVSAPGFLNSPKITRLNPDGSLDTAFSDGSQGIGSFDRYATVMALQADGKIYANVASSGPLLAGRTLFRLNADGSLDTGYTNLNVNERPTAQGRIHGVTVLPDGRVFVYGNTPYGYLAQLNPDGTKNTSFEGPDLTAPPDSNPQPVRPFINSIGVQSDGKIVFTGMFVKANGVDKLWAGRLNTNGSVDAAYTPQPPFTTAEDKLVKIYAGDKALFVRPDAPKKFIRTNPDGTVDNTYSAPDLLTGVSRWLALPDDKLLVYGIYNGVTQYVRLNSDGSVDAGFTSPTFEREGSISKITVQADGKALIWGGFVKVNGAARPGLARVNADGTLDATFDPGAGFSDGAVIFSMVEQTDGKILIGGVFSSYNGSTRTHIARLNSDGSIDAAFNPVIAGTGPSIQAIAVRADGKILIGGKFASVNSTPRTSIAVLNADGTLEGTFNPTFSAAATIQSLLVQGDGKIMVGGSFSGVNGFNRTNLVRLNSDGTLDTTFNAGSVSQVPFIHRYADGKYLVASNGLRRLNSDGTADGTFTPTSATSFGGILPLPDGTTLYSSGSALVHLFVNGAVDTFFVPASANATIRALAKQPDGRILVGGDFTRLGNSPRTSLARIVIAAFYRSTMYDFDGDRKSDFMVTRPSTYDWHLLTNGTYNYTAIHFGTTGDKVVPADYDGDGKTDIAIWRPSTGDWWWRSSLTGAMSNRRIGTSADTPIPSDTDGNGKADMVVVSPGGLWTGIDVATGNVIVSYQFSSPGDKPVVGDFDGDGKFDLAYFRPSNGTWYYNKSSSGANLELGIVQWGLSTDIPAPADYDGDGKTDIAVFRPSEGNWYVLNSGGGYVMVHFGATGDKPIPADYDGDGKADIAVFRPSDGYWYQLLTTGGYTGLPWGISTDIPSPNALLPSADPPRLVTQTGRK